MSVINLLRHLLAILALVGLVAGTAMASSLPATTHSATSQGIDQPSMVMDGMDCDHAKKQSIPDCGHACPWASLCAPHFLQSQVIVALSRIAVVYAYPPMGDEQGDKRTEPPRPRPPRT